MQGSTRNEDVLPLHAEFASVGKRMIARTVRVDRVTLTRFEDLAIELARETVSAERIKRGPSVPGGPEIREEDGVIVIPVVEEVLVTERRLILTEEIRIRRVRTSRPHTERVAIRAQDIVITRLKAFETTEGNTSMSNETIVALFDTSSHAELAVQDLLAAGIPVGSIERHAAGAAETARFEERSGASRPGFWSRLFGAEPEVDTGAYDRSIEQGATVVSVRPTAERLDDVVRILEGHHPVDMDERDAAATGSSGATAGLEHGLRSDRDDTDGKAAWIASDGLAANRRIDAELPLEMAPGTGSSDHAELRAETIALSAEALSVDKRVIHRGGTRVRRYVVESPVEEQISLHGERVSVERRAVDGFRAPEAGSFTERAVEMTETDEVPVVTKNTRVVEEVVLRKDVTDRVETVRDTVRREDVAIEPIAHDGTAPR